MSSEAEYVYNKPKLSIIIPTKDRSEYLIESLKSMMDLLDKNVEIVVHDNSINSSKVKDFLKEGNTKIKYYHIEEYLSVSENCNLAISKATGEYVTMIGDDDSVSTLIFDILDWMKLESIDSCIFDSARFYWKDIVFKKIKYSNLSFNKSKFKGKKIDSFLELKKILKKGGTTLGKMPKVYHGLVKKSILDSVNEKYSTYFPGPSPDMANAVALSMITKKHYYSPVPAIISGYSLKSAGGMGARGKHSSKLENIAHISKAEIEKWEKKNPKYWLPETVWAESMLKTIKYMNEDLHVLFNWNYLYASIYANHIRIRDEISPVIKSNSNIYLIKVTAIFIRIRKLIKFVRGLLKFKYNKLTRFNISDMMDLNKARNFVDKKFNTDKFKRYYLYKGKK